MKKNTERVAASRQWQVVSHDDRDEWKVDKCGLARNLWRTAGAGAGGPGGRGGQTLLVFRKMPTYFAEINLDI